MRPPVFFHVIARAVIFVDGHVLVAHAKGEDHTFLPGGHVEPGEPVTRSLARELQEELGVAAHVHGYLGAVESGWKTNGERHHEINHVFAVTAPGLLPAAAPASREPHLEFVWSSPDELDGRNLLPRVLRHLLRRWASGDASTWWATDQE